MSRSVNTFGRPRRRAGARRLTHVTAAAVALLSLAVVAGCSAESGDGVTGVSVTAGTSLDGGTATGAQTGAARVLIGEWFRIEYVSDAAGVVRTFETTLALRADGSLTRRVVSRNLSTGLADSVTLRGRWSATARTLTITITSTGDPFADPFADPFMPASGLPPMVPNPPFSGNPTFSGGSTTGLTTGTVRFTYRVDTAANGAQTLFIDGTAYVRISRGPTL